MDTNLNSMRSCTVVRDKIQYQSSKFFRYIFLQQCAKSKLNNFSEKRQKNKKKFTMKKYTQYILPCQTKATYFCWVFIIYTIILSQVTKNQSYFFFFLFSKLYFYFSNSFKIIFLRLLDDSHITKQPSKINSSSKNCFYSENNITEINFFFFFSTTF